MPREQPLGKIGGITLKIDLGIPRAGLQTWKTFHEISRQVRVLYDFFKLDNLSKVTCRAEYLFCLHLCILRKIPTLSMLKKGGPLLVPS